MKVYIIQQGEYSDRHICAVCDSREKAEAVAKLFRKYDFEGEDEYYRPDIEEWDTETFIPLTQRYKLFNCMYSTRLKSITIEEVELSDSYLNQNEIGRIQVRSDYFRNPIYITYLMAENQDIAKKIFLDKFAEYKAIEQGIKL